MTCAALAGATFAAVGYPLPWILEPLLVTAALRLNGVALTEYPRIRSTGQWIVAVFLGLRFRAQTLTQVARLATLLASVCLLILGVDMLAAVILQRVGRLDFATALPGASMRWRR
jgi:uncharacterized membrane protein AbrB (regulator of aidB expression)